MASATQSGLRVCLPHAGSTSALLVATLALAGIGCDRSPSPVTRDGEVPPADASFIEDLSELPPVATLSCPPDTRIGFVPLGAAAAVTKVKNLLLGLPPSDTEVQAVLADPAALPGLINRWMASPQYNEKMLSFFVSSFQQDQFTYDHFVFQFVQYYPFPEYRRPLLQDFQQSFARTAMALIAEGRPFTDTMTTTRFMMTPAMMATYALLDIIEIDDRYNRVDTFQRSFPVSVTLQSSRMIPIEQAVDPTSPNFMTFYDPTIATSYGPGCPQGTIVYPAPVEFQVLADFLFGEQPRAFGPDRCQPPRIPRAARYIDDDDFTAWHMVTIRQPRSGELPTPFYDLPSMRAGRELVLHVPRISFFTTPAFNARWPTNTSNQARVLLNQTMIVALGKPIDLTNVTEPRDRAAIDLPHAPLGSTCYGCHQSLDPMRQFFRQAYSLYGSVQGDFAQRAMAGQFNFHGVSMTGTGIADLGAQLAAHPMFATAWVQKLCTYATSAPCEETDPEFRRIVGVFRDSNHSWNTLVQALFASPLVTYLSETQTARSIGQSFPIARQEHLCATLSNRLGVPDLCGLDVTTASPSPVAHALASSWPSGQYSRGDPTPSLAIDPSPLIRGGMESLCADLAQRFVDSGPTSAFRSADPTTAVHNLATLLMGLTSERVAEPQAILRSHFEWAQRAGASPSDALKSTFVLACISPYVAGMGQ